MKLKILLADDHDMLLESLADSINQSEFFEVVATAINGQEVLQKLQIYEVDVLVCDIQMPVLDGISTVLQVRQLYPNVKILMLSMLEDANMIEKAIQVGANGYVLKKAKKAELEKAILSVAKGEKYFAKEILQILKIEEPIQDNLPSGLTLREIEVLKLIAREFSSTQIATELNISLNTVESHRKNIYQKLKLKNLAGAIRFALQNHLIA
jgi:DNA-binding NarL/FixJ family response regulator